MSLVPNIKYKTEYCLYWQEGKICEKGNYCFFAHGTQELRSIEENHQEILRRTNQAGPSEGKPPNYKTVFCKFYAQGQCKLGERCTYAHERRQKRKKRPSQQYQLDSNNIPADWQALQYYDYYNQYYYLQQYQMNYPCYGQENFQMGTLHTEIQKKQQPSVMKNGESQFKLQQQQNGIITHNNPISSIEKKESKQTEGDKALNKESPQTEKTESPSHPAITNLELFSSSTQFKEEI